MKRILIGQGLLILCCAFYLSWWYRGYRPGVTVSRVGGMNGALLLITALLGLSGLVFSLSPLVPQVKPIILSQYILIAGIASYILLLVITRGIFHRVVTTELFLIVGWTMLEVSVINKLHAAGVLTSQNMTFLLLVVAVATIISLILYVAYYRMEEMRAFYAAMVPLITEATAMAILLFVTLRQ